MKQRELRVVEIDTGKIVHRVALPEGASDRYVERVTSGMLRNMDRERFCVAEGCCGGGA